MAKSIQEVHDMAEETIATTFEFTDIVEKNNDSFFRHVPKYQISYLISAVRQLGATVLNLSNTALKQERLIEIKDEEIDALNREKLNLILEINHLKAKLGD